MKVAVLKGGRSLERQVSLRSGARVEDALAPLGHEVVRDRRRMRTSSARLKRGAPTSPSSPCTAPTARTAPSRSCSRSSASPTPAPASPPAGARIDKVAAKHELRDAGIPTPDWVAFSATAFRELGAADALEEIEEPARLPARRQAGARRLLARRPLRRRADDVPEALVAAFSYDDRVLLERHVDGRELAVAILDGEPLPVVEAIPKEEDQLQLRGPLRDRPHRVRLPGAS